MRQARKRVLVTGAGGFVGAALTRRLLAEGHEVHAVQRLGGNPWRLGGVLDQVRLHAADLSDPAAAVRVVGKARPEWVFHLAAFGNSSWETDPLAIMRTNLLGTAGMLQACLRKGFEAFIHAGSSAEYGFKDHPPAEGEALEPNSHYAVSKAAATLHCRQVAGATGARVVTLRLYSVYGPWEEPRRLVPMLVVRGLRKRLPPLVEPDVARDFVFVDDVCDAFLAAAVRGGSGEVYNVGTGRQTTVRRAVEVARSVLGIDQEPRWGSMPNRSWDTRSWNSDPRKMRRELRLRTFHGFEEGFRKTVAWLKSDRKVWAFYSRRCAGR
ncbi:MAG: NAD-dependent epimerase/dehydratase family protein [Elusimicrobiota bacterium]|jgi:dolichol-phosphate mannosyltransferase